MRLPNLLSVLLLVPITLVALATASCERRCEDQSNCRVACECQDDSRIVPCGLDYRCEGNSVCSSEFGTASCPEICDTYPEKGLCFSQQCANEDECVRETVCNTVDPMTGAVLSEFPCTRFFGCDADLNVCEAGFILTDTEICQLCANEGVVGASAGGLVRPAIVD